MTENNPVLTVVTVCFNLVKNGRVASFRNCMDSVHTQSYGEIEHLVIDGGSTDGTVDLIREYADIPGFRWISEPDHGIYDAMNKGIRLAAGKYVVFVNSDDAFSDQYSAKAIVTALEREGADYAFANARVYSASHAEFRYEWKSRIDDIPFGYYPCHQTFVCRTEILRELGGFSEKYLANDNHLMLRVVLGYKPVYVDRVVVDFHEGGISGGMVADAARMKSETTGFFYELFGKNAGLSRSECQSLYERQCFSLPHNDVFRIGSKLCKPFWVRRYFELHDEQAKNRRSCGSRQVRFKLFGRIPLLSSTIA